MGFFRRGRSAEQQRAGRDAAIVAFWSWWAESGHDEAALAFDEGPEAGHDLVALAETIGRRLEAVDPGLAFETGAGRLARHLLAVTSAGDPDLRDVAARWLAGAPDPSDSFEYADARQPVADPSGLRITLDGYDVDLGSCSMQHAVEGATVHVRVGHPVFAGLPDDARGQITFLFLDALLGERVVEERIGEISWAAGEEAGATPLTGLPGIVAAAGASSLNE